MAALMVLVAPAAGAAEIVASAFKISGDEQTTVFEAELSDDTGYTATVIPDPYRVLIDMPNVSFDVPPGTGRKSKGLVKFVRYGIVEEGKSRIVIDTKGPVLITRSQLIPAAGKKNARILVELLSISEEVFRAAFAKDRQPKPAAQRIAENVTASDIVGSVTPAATEPQKKIIKPVPKPIANAKPKAIFAKPQRADGKKVIVIDPGHGGIDPGALSPRRTKEKDVVLAFAKDLQAILRERKRYHVALTREDDRFVSLKDRVQFARKEGADLFIAVHADTVRGKTVTGTTLYTLSEKASDEEAEVLAQKENRADAIAGIDLDMQNQDVADVLIDLVQRESKNSAISFSRVALGQLKPVTKMTGKPIRSAGFTVLKAPDVPSLLIELGYLSNPADEERLVSPAWRKAIAKALARAIDGFFSDQVARTP